MMGIEHDLFWTMSYKSIDPYIRAFHLKKKQDDEQAWRNGLYVAMAIGSAFDKKAKYPDMPLTAQLEFDANQEDIEIRRARAIKQTMLERMTVINSRFVKEGG